MFDIMKKSAKNREKAKAQGTRKAPFALLY